MPVEGMTIDYEGDVCVIRIDLSKELGFTGKGSGIRIATTAGALQLWKDGQPTHYRLNLNLWRSLRPDERREAKDLKLQRQRHILMDAWKP